MDKRRIEAMSDGVIAIIITIMVLELRPPDGIALRALEGVIPTAMSYAMSFVILGIYWNNHHHLFQVVTTVNGYVLWANLHLLFWLSLIPFITSWVGENDFAPMPVAVYGVLLLCASIAFYVLVRTLRRVHGVDSVLWKALQDDSKGRFSMATYAAAIPVAFFLPILACALYVAVGLAWLRPDRRIEKALGH